ncbi:hypothetical protein COEREDRAFT_81875 [Coemansia reversa NRRL 1564]|uniref:Uncharacterized protein n=1 Tax=Coemansia reversa (strain ATCC 12441 / NRRL 1564) TaxID=763665 RepID=A0A2G5B957_COERN|nr:hypothetical protein COEREDRAFT_81875 [Coemansia reversa NRRL 1564]|eukprot:PIA15541.1 hypothetical protein COEREDRAFT_81875 [Coemansia reversa NRRL 1564]
MDSYQKRAHYDQVGDYLYSQDLCIGVFDGTNYNSGTCIRKELDPPYSKYPTEEMIIRDNTVDVKNDYIAGAMVNLTSESQAQCIMTDANNTACWIWNNSMDTCLMRSFYKFGQFNYSDTCNRTNPINSGFVKYVRLENFETPSSTYIGIWNKVSLKTFLLVSLTMFSLLF